MFIPMVNKVPEGCVGIATVKHFTIGPVDSS